MLFGEDFYARKSVRMQQQAAQAYREKMDPRIGIPSKSLAYSTELIDGYDLTDQFQYIPDDSVEREHVQQVYKSFMIFFSLSSFLLFSIKDN